MQHASVVHQQHLSGAPTMLEWARLSKHPERGSVRNVSPAGSR